MQNKQKYGSGQGERDASAQFEFISVSFGWTPTQLIFFHMYATPVCLSARR